MRQARPTSERERERERYHMKKVSREPPASAINHNGLKNVLQKRPSKTNPGAREKKSKVIVSGTKVVKNEEFQMQERFVERAMLAIEIEQSYVGISD